VDDGRVLYGIEKIREVNPQRFEMEQITAIVHIDVEQKLIVGYKDVTENEFWVRGHMPEYPLMPGVIMCEAGAQLGGFFSKMYVVPVGSFIVFGGMEEVRFRGQVKPGDRFWLVSKTVKVNRRQVVNQIQGFVQGKMVFEGTLIGMPFTPPGAESEKGNSAGNSMGDGAT
ncbi:MAG TPA: 3-hydroxyacyl-ACP dehydratase FabZ family protein, partial [Gemmatales bacterium]|nr:3-hydroxyacyl-ACP dehydratase FabZ family protein [Gemmatales bacterium]